MHGYVWQKVTLNAPFAPRDGLGVLSFQNRLWVIGGWNPMDKTNFPKVCNNEVWSSVNGVSWRLESPNTFGFLSFDPLKHWEGRHTAGYVVFRDRMWVIGGDANQGYYLTDIWSSSNGRIWEKMADGKDVPWAPRVLFHTVVFKERIYVMGGQTLHWFAGRKGEIDHFYRDIWSSADGIHWEKVEPAGNFWSARGQIGGCAVLNGKVYIMGGGTYDTPEFPERKFYNDVWCSDDMIHWTCLTENAPWEPRQYHDVAAWDGNLWVLEGIGTDQKNRNDVWFSSDGKNWNELKNSPWKPRHAAGVVVHDNALWLIAGNNMESDVWKLVRKP